MGSFLTVVNDTPDMWQCKVWLRSNIGPSLGIRAGFIATTISTAIATHASNTASLATSINATHASNTASLATSIKDALAKKKFYEILPEDRRRYDLKIRVLQMTIQDRRKGECVRTEILGENTVRVFTLVMNPMVGGWTADSNRDHYIQYWIKRKGVKSYIITNGKILN